MRLQGVFDGTLYATRYRTLYRESTPDRFERVGTLPAPGTGREGLAYRLKTTRGWKSALSRLVGRFPSVNVWQLTETDLLATADTYVFRSGDGGTNWTVSRRLPDSSGPMGILPTGLCVHEGDVYLGEYPLADVTPRIHRSPDRGQTWTTVAELPGVRHVHAVQSDPDTGELWVTTGDTDEECRIGRLRDGELSIVGSGSQRWRAVELAVTRDAILWGVDSVYRETNPIFRLDRSAIDGDPTVVFEASNSIYYATTLTIDSTEWVVVSTAMEAGRDRTGPTEQTIEGGQARVLAASSATDFESWHELAAYEKRSVPVDRWNPRESAPIANAYVFLAADPDRGLVTNPYNTAQDDGSIVVYPPEYFVNLE